MNTEQRDALKDMRDHYLEKASQNEERAMGRMCLSVAESAEYALTAWSKMSFEEQWAVQNRLRSFRKGVTLPGMLRYV